jgi:exopolysaccharide biosynthesis protein
MSAERVRQPDSAGDTALPEPSGLRTRREFLRDLGLFSAALALRPWELAEAAGSKSAKALQGIRAHGVEYDYGTREGVRLHMLSFKPGVSDAHMGVHFSTGQSTVLKVAKFKPALAVTNGTFFGDEPLGCAAADGKVLYEAPMYVRRLHRAVLFVRTDGSVGFDDFKEEHKLVDLSDPNADYSSLGFARWEMDAIKGYRDKHGFKKVEDMRHVGLPKETVWRVMDELSVGKPSETITRSAEAILKADNGIRDLLGGGGWLVRDGKPVCLGCGDPSVRSVNEYARRVHQFTSRGGALKASERTIVATKSGGKEVFLIVAEGSASLDKLAQVMESYKMENAIFLDGGGSSEMVLQGDDGRHRIVNGGERHMKTYITLTKGQK